MTPRKRRNRRRKPINAKPKDPDPDETEQQQREAAEDEALQAAKTREIEGEEPVTEIGPPTEVMHEVNPDLDPLWQQSVDLPTPDPVAIAVQVPVNPALANGIQILRALLREAEGGYIADGIDQIARIEGEQFDPLETEILSRTAAERSSDGLPDIAYAYQFLQAYRNGNAENQE